MRLPKRRMPVATVPAFVDGNGCRCKQGAGPVQSAGTNVVEAALQDGIHSGIGKDKMQDQDRSIEPQTWALPTGVATCMGREK